jgi:two-component system chemotaxis sensor kinase CheA
MEQYREVFLSESAEFVQGIVDGLLALEQDPSEAEPVETVFRGAHSLKGMAAAMGYDRTTELTHRMESLMDAVRRGDRTVDAELVDLMLKAVDTVRLLIGEEASGGEHADETEILEALAAEVSDGADEEAAGEDTDAEGGRVSLRGAVGIEAHPSAESETEQPEYRVKVTLEESCQLRSVRAYMVLKRLDYMGVVTGTVPSVEDIEDERFGRTFEATVRTPGAARDVEEAALAVTEVEDACAEPVDEPGEERAEERTTPARAEAVAHTEAQTVRVSISHLDEMVNLMGELVIVRSRLESLAERYDDATLDEVVDDLHRVTGELQYGVMQTRMVPVGNIFNRFPRAVRDLARELGKEVTFETEGLGIELDRTVLDEIGDPILHLLRNAVDHGIETPDEREKAGKPRKGVIRLAAGRERDNVLITVTDDGRGLDPERICAKAVERGLVDGEAAEGLSEGEILLYVCEPGFSTAETATKVSGRGVGMDVVKGKIEYLGGSLSIETERGRGSRFTLVLPLTLAIAQALIVVAQERLFAIPLSAVSEVVPPDEMTLERVDGRPVVVLRSEDVVGIDELQDVVGLDPVEEEDAQAEPVGLIRRDRKQVVLIDTPDGPRALSVDSLLGRREIVIKPLTAFFAGLRGLGGVALMGDGRLAMVLDPRTMFAMGKEPV